MLNNRDNKDNRHIFATFHSPSGTEHITQSNLKFKTTENYYSPPPPQVCVRKGRPRWSSNYHFCCCYPNWTDSLALAVKWLVQIRIQSWVPNRVNRLSLGICTHTAPMWPHLMIPPGAERQGHEGTLLKHLVPRFIMRGFVPPFPIHLNMVWLN
jgi:hypothetical protein